MSFYYHCPKCDLIFSDEDTKFSGSDRICPLCKNPVKPALVIFKNKIWRKTQLAKSKK